MSFSRIAFTVTAFFLTTSALTHAEEGKFTASPGLQLYSLRSQFKLKGVSRTLDTVKSFGIQLVELAGTHEMPIPEFKKELESRGLKAVSAHYPYKRWQTEPDAVAQEAKELGLEYAGCAWADHKSPMDEAQAREIAATFNQAGAALAKVGIKFFYHLHGFEYQPWKKGETLADLIIQETNPEQVKFQMDTLWVVFPGQDPVKLLEKYPNRWDLMHLKDLKQGVATGSLSGQTDVNNDVTLGTGQMNWAAILATAQKVGVKYYFIEDESSSSESQIPKSVKFLQSIRW
ncbi:Sugar phosphate isomerase/epimerase [Prosthecobacter debontii]|uniref:Sugar phosphate isomerase/epimerase n=1 Tax=Prosthecobacter debontii TaxID=48467 RepID=A0A1T4YKQ3_9BACT|nr:sugar phosphate isomerase/epimerase [Prosthecobacter debontii]SKB02280.1 Sugar phosphate isomerase/epimerase [Prosthecobacter debontii]